MHTNSQSQSSNTLNNALTRNRQILKLLFEETRSMFFKESSLVPMWEGPSAKVTKPFAACLFIRLQFYSLMDKEYPITYSIKNFVTHQGKKNCFLQYQEKIFSFCRERNFQPITNCHIIPLCLYSVSNCKMPCAT